MKSPGSSAHLHPNLGTGASLVAACAPMIDYVLNVAVGISSGVGALTSAVPSLHVYTLALQLIAELQRQHRNRPIAILLPDVVKKHWWQYPLHSHRLRRLQAALLRYGGSDIVVTIIPWHLEEPRIQKGLEEEEEALPASAETADK